MVATSSVSSALTTTPDDRASAFYSENRAAAVAWATALTGRTDVGEELAQEALLRVAGRLDEIRKPAAYLRVAVVNSCRSWHRSTARDVRRAQRDHRGRTDTAMSGLSEATVEMFEMLSALPYRQRASVLLRFWAGWSDAEIAESLGCRPASVRVYVHRAMSTLRSALEDQP